MIVFVPKDDIKIEFAVEKNPEMQQIIHVRKESSCFILISLQKICSGYI